MSNLMVLVIGSLNTDIIASGLKDFPQPGQHTYGEVLSIAPGGKSRNAAHMMSLLLRPGEVAMVGVTVEDRYGFWRVPIDALNATGVDTSGVVKLIDPQQQKLPGIALITVNTRGQNEIVLVPGVSRELSPSHIDSAQIIFDQVAQNSGFLCLGLEAPLESVVYAAKKAAEMGIKVILDPGGAKQNVDYTQLMNESIFLIKPNEHEAKILTGVEVHDLQTAKAAGEVFQQKGMKHILITMGGQGAYFISEKIVEHIPVPRVKKSNNQDETGCGDQTLATLVVSLVEGKSLLTASRTGVLAGTLQFYKSGVVPITKMELEEGESYVV